MKDRKPAKKERELVKQFIDNALNSVSGHKIAAVQKRRQKLGRQVLNQLPTPDNYQHLNHSLKAILQKSVAYTHPTEMSANDILNFFFKKLSTIEMT